MTDFTYFTVEGDLLAVVAAVTATSTPERAYASGKVRFTPYLDTGEVFVASGLTPRPAAVLPYNNGLAYFDDNGRLAFGGTTGVKLLANTAVLGISGDLTYRVQFIDIYIQGFRVQVNDAYLVAPTVSTTVNLADWITQAGGTSAVALTADVPPLLIHGGTAFETGDETIGGGGS